MIFIILSITLLYLLLIGSFIWGIDRVKSFHLSGLKSQTGFSIIIPFRNEASNLPSLLASIANLNYPKNLYEIIFVDDESDDNSVALLMAHIDHSDMLNTQIKVVKTIRTTESPKKDAITLGVSLAKNEWIITTDADSVLPKYWLDIFDEFIQHQDLDFIVAPLTYLATHGFLQNFQLLDILSLQGATMGGFGINRPFLCNGANLAYRKKLFITLKGFEGNSEIASGDDVFLLEKATRFDKVKVGYLKCEQAIVFSSAVTTRKDLIEQRVRWAAKSSAYNNLFGKLAGFIILLENALVLWSLALVGIGLISPKEFLYIVIMKFCIDLLLVQKAAQFFDQKRYLKHFLLAAMYYPFFSVYVASLAFFKGYRWKDRQYRR